MRFHQSILSFENGRYRKVALVLSAASIAIYVWYEPPLPHPKAYGGTWVGYLLGIAAALLILWLLVLGVRKRAYRSTLGTVQGWTSAHVYLGLTVLLLATLHCAFEFGWNIHTYAYALLVTVVVSGITGVYAYLKCPKLLTKNLGEDTLHTLALKIADLDDQCSQLALHLPERINLAVRHARRAHRRQLRTSHRRQCAALPHAHRRRGAAPVRQGSARRAGRPASAIDAGRYAQERPARSRPARSAPACPAAGLAVCACAAFVCTARRVDRPHRRGPVFLVSARRG